MDTGSLAVSLHSSGPVRLAAEFDCAAGELLALVGPSGSGKSSLLRAVAGLLPHGNLRGSVTVGGQAWFDSARGIALPPQQRKVGLVFQSYALFPHLNAIKNVAVAAHPAWLVADFALLFARLGLADLALRKPAQLSGGQQQRVALARAVVRLGPPGSVLGSAQASELGSEPSKAKQPMPQSPSVLLLDEPFSAVDAPTRQTLYRELASLRQSLAVPMVLVTHDLHEARRLADRVVIVDGGASLQSGTPQHVFGSPRNARVAELVGIQNHFAGRFEKHTEGWGWLHWGSGVGAVRLQVVDKNKLAHGASVTWVVAGELLELHAEPVDAGDAANTLGSVLPSNTLRCQLREALSLGEVSLCTLVPQGLPQECITLNVATAQLRALHLEKGSWLCLGLPPHSVHIMPLREGPMAGAI